jgi:hypothetical protein
MIVVIELYSTIAFDMATASELFCAGFRHRCHPSSLLSLIELLHRSTLGPQRRSTNSMATPRRDGNVSWPPLARFLTFHTHHTRLGGRDETRSASHCRSEQPSRSLGEVHFCLYSSSHTHDGFADHVTSIRDYPQVWNRPPFHFTCSTSSACLSSWYAECIR